MAQMHLIVARGKLVSQLADILEFDGAVKSGIARNPALAEKKPLIEREEIALGKRFITTYEFMGHPDSLPFTEARAEIKQREEGRRRVLQLRKRDREEREAALELREASFA